MMLRTSDYPGIPVLGGRSLAGCFLQYNSDFTHCFEAINAGMAMNTAKDILPSSMNSKPEIARK